MSKMFMLAGAAVCGINAMNDLLGIVQLNAGQQAICAFLFLIMSFFCKDE